MTADNFGDDVSVKLDLKAGEGCMVISPDPDPANIRKALAFLDEQGWEELDPLETGDDPEEDNEGRTLVPLAKIWGR